MNATLGYEAEAPVVRKERVWMETLRTPVIFIAVYR
jgi:hypothetical protein